ncbi:MAG: hypothetical protein ACI84C_001901 [Flavobacteriales bacterium]|jgi:hypothetical protein
MYVCDHLKRAIVISFTDLFGCTFVIVAEEKIVQIKQIKQEFRKEKMVFYASGIFDLVLKTMLELNKLH